MQKKQEPTIQKNGDMNLAEMKQEKEQKSLLEMTPQEREDYLEENPFEIIWVTKKIGGDIKSIPVLASEFYKENLEEEITPYSKVISVMDFLQNLGIDMITIVDFVDDKMVDKSYQIIKENPKATKKDILEKLNEVLTKYK